MKNLALSLSAVTIILFASCGHMEMKPISMDQVTQIEDSIPKIMPGVRSIHTLQDDDYSKVVIIVGSQSLYTVDAGLQQAAAVRTGVALLHVLGADNNLSSAKLVFSQKDINEKKVPADGISVDMKIDSLKKALFPKK